MKHLMKTSKNKRLDIRNSPKRMKNRDFYTLALKGWGPMAITPILFLTLAFYLLINAGTTQYTLQQEKNQPCELIVTGEGLNNKNLNLDNPGSLNGEGLTDTDVAKILEIQDVLAATLIYPVSAHLQMDSLQADVILYGISSDYLKQKLCPIPQIGTIFPETSSMPYLFLNEAAACELINIASKSKSPASSTGLQGTGQQSLLSGASYDWLNAEVIIILDANQTGTGKSVVSRICGVESLPESTQSANSTDSADSINSIVSTNFIDSMDSSDDLTEITSETNENTAQYYISIQAAKELMLNAGSSPTASEIHIQITSSGQEERVSSQLQSMGYSVENSNPEKWNRWQEDEETINSTLFSAAISLFAAILLLREKLKLDQLLHLKEYQHLERLVHLEEYQHLERLLHLEEYQHCRQPDFDLKRPERENRVLHRLNQIRIAVTIFVSAGFSILLTWIIPLFFQGAF